MVVAPDAESIFALLKRLTELPGPVGQEDAVQDWIAERWSTFCSDVRRTRVNNVLAKVGGTGPRLLIMAHADEINFMVKSITDDGFLHIWPYYGDTRGYPPRWIMPLNQPALVLTSDSSIDGIFATASGHVVGGRDEPGFKYAWNDWFIDIGVQTREEAEHMGVFPGCRVIWNPETRRLGEHRVHGKAMDDRAALAIATLAGEALARLVDELPYEVWLGSTIQEENGLIGATSILDAIDVDLCINLDVGLTGDIPGPDKRDFPSSLGAGPVVVYQDSSVHYTRELCDRLHAAGVEAGLPVQRAIYQQYGSDAAWIIRRGAQAVLLTYPTRYTHSPVETVDLRDVGSCIDLLVTFACKRSAGV